MDPFEVEVRRLTDEELVTLITDIVHGDEIGQTLQGVRTIANNVGLRLGIPHASSIHCARNAILMTAAKKFVAEVRMRR